MQTYFVQAILGDSFEDLYIQARSPEAAIEKAKKVTTLKSRWTRFVV